MSPPTFVSDDGQPGPSRPRIPVSYTYRDSSRSTFAEADNFTRNPPASRRGTVQAGRSFRYSSDSAPPPRGWSRALPTGAATMKMQMQMPSSEEGVPSGSGFVVTDSDTATTSVLSDEYDLAQEDTTVFQEVQRALALKARREARLRALNTEPALQNEFPDRVSESPGSTASRSLPDDLRVGNSLDLDFAPSTAAPTHLHPVPSSSDDGVTLDWTGQFPGDHKSERRWKLSLTKRKDKGKIPLNSVLIQKQGGLYADRIARIKAKASSQTLRKAEITSGQLQRRYDILHRSLHPPSNPLNMLSVFRWYSSLWPSTKAHLERTEPLSWLKHLESHRQEGTSRSPYRISAFIVEEFLRSQTLPGVETMQTIPEDSTPSLWMSSSPIRSQYESPHHSNVSLDDEQVSFEPFLARQVAMNMSRRRSEDVHRFWGSLSGSAALPGNSNANGGLRGSTAPYLHRTLLSPYHSPASSRVQVKDTSHPPHSSRADSDDGFSSARDSVLDDTSDVLGANTVKGRRKPFSRLTPERNDSSDAYERHRASTTNVASAQPSDGEPIARSTSISLTVPITSSGAATFGRKTLRVSLPVPDRLLANQELKRQMDADEEQARQEYEMKAQMLDDAVAQNQRVRQMLQRVAFSLKEYDSLQSNLIKTLGLPPRSLPPELLEAISHDPSAVTGATRRFPGWRAVEYIHSRLARQRETFRAFKSIALEGGCVVPDLQCGLNDLIPALVQSLEALESCTMRISTKAQVVTECLTSVKGVLDALKAEYKSTVAHTSVIYPELSHIIALEENYRDQYKQLWDFGMSALTVLLDTVVPFWRTYGTTIGDDVKDFLVIPWYRNEYTGEARRYPIQQFPKRSLRHWGALLLFFTISVGVGLLQARAAIVSIIHARLTWISHDGLRWTVMPFFWVGIVIQCCVLLIEWAVVAAQLGVVVWWLGWLMKFNT